MWGEAAAGEVFPFDFTNDEHEYQLVARLSCSLPPEDVPEPLSEVLTVPSKPELCGRRRHCGASRSRAPALAQREQQRRRRQAVALPGEGASGSQGDRPTYADQILGKPP